MNKINIKSYQAIETSFNQDHFDLRFNSTSSFPFGRFLGRMPLSWGKSSLMLKAMAHELGWHLCVTPYFSDTWFHGTFNYLDWCPNILLFISIFKPKVINISNKNIFPSMRNLCNPRKIHLLMLLLLLGRPWKTKLYLSKEMNTSNLYQIGK